LALPELLQLEHLHCSQRQVGAMEYRLFVQEEAIQRERYVQGNQGSLQELAADFTQQQMSCHHLFAHQQG